MPAPKVRSDFDALNNIAKSIKQQADATAKTSSALKNKMGTLQGGDWVGKGANKFYSEMSSHVLPALQRLSTALTHGSAITLKISALMKQADDDVARLFKTGDVGGADGSQAAASGGASAMGDGPMLSAPMSTVGSNGQMRPVDPGAVSGIVRAGESGGENPYYSEQAVNNRAVDRVLGVFDEDVRNIVKQSPTLSSQLREAELNGYTFVMGEEGKGSFHNTTARRIVVENEGTPAQIASTIAHETGHGQYLLHEQVTIPPQENMSRDVYVELNVEEKMRNEGYAQLNATKIRDEILSAGGPDIGVPGNQSAGYIANYEAYKAGTIDQETAIMNNAELMGAETTSTSKLNYLDYYSESYEANWDESLINQEAGAS
jgi:WXG100 family type VII secretion target